MVIVKDKKVIVYI